MLTVTRLLGSLLGVSRVSAVEVVLFQHTPNTLEKFTVTPQVLFCGAVWLLPSATLMVMVALPSATPVTRTVSPDTSTVATLVLLDCAEIAPFPARFTAIVLNLLEELRVIAVLSKVKLPAALPIDQGAVFAPVPPSLH